MVPPEPMTPPMPPLLLMPKPPPEVEEIPVEPPLMPALLTDSVVELLVVVAALEKLTRLPDGVAVSDDWLTFSSVPPSRPAEAEPRVSAFVVVRLSQFHT